MIKCKYLFLGHHKCSSTYVKSIFVDVARLLRYTVKELNFSQELPMHECRNLDIFLLLNANRSLVDLHFSELKNTKCIHVVRDPRDIIVSGYFSHLHSHPTENWPELIPHRTNLAKLDKISGLKAEMDFVEPFLRDMNSWDFVNHENFMTIKMEELIEDPYAKWLQVFEFMNVVDDSFASSSLKQLSKLLLGRVRNRLFPNSAVGRMTTDEALRIVYKNRFEAKTKGRKPGVENVMDHYRKGVPGDWKNHFNHELLTYFKDRYDDILTKYQYSEN